MINNHLCLRGGGNRGETVFTPSNYFTLPPSECRKKCALGEICNMMHLNGKGVLLHQLSPPALKYKELDARGSLDLIWCFYMGLVPQELWNPAWPSFSFGVVCLRFKENFKFLEFKT